MFDSVFDMFECLFNFLINNNFLFIFFSISFVTFGISLILRMFRKSFISSDIEFPIDKTENSIKEETKNDIEPDFSYIRIRASIKQKYTNCPNCNAPMDSNICSYCGSKF